jgi:hypothetical protein
LSDSDSTLRFALRLTLVNTDERAEAELAPVAEDPEARKLDGIEGIIDEGSLKVADTNAIGPPVLAPACALQAVLEMISWVTEASWLKVRASKSA